MAPIAAAAQPFRASSLTRAVDTTTTTMGDVPDGPAVETPEPDPDGWATAGLAFEKTQQVTSDMWDKATQPNVIYPVIGANVVAAGGATVLQMRESTMRPVQVAQAFSGNFVINGVRITAPLVAAILGPAIADGVSYVAPKLVPKYQNSMNTTQKLDTQTRRAAVGGAATFAIGSGVYLLKPDLVKPIMGATAAETAISRAGSGSFANRMTLGIVGGAVALGLANHAWNATDAHTKETFKKGAAIAAGATAVGVLAAGRLTKNAPNAFAPLAHLPENGLLPFWKPNVGAVKSYALTVGPLTAAAAGSAYKYMNTFNDFNRITGVKPAPPTQPPRK